MKPIALLKAAIVGTALLTTAAHASLLEGKTVRYTYAYPDVNTAIPFHSPGDYVVGPGVEVHSDLYDIDFSDTNITIVFNHGNLSFSAGAFNGAVIADATNNIGSFTNATLNPATDLAGFTADRLTFDADHIYVNFQNLGVIPSLFGSVVSIDVQGGSSTNVPEPGSLALMGLGLFGLAGRRKIARN